nr:uncharacterized protein LOC111420462 isoform X2 [Onthophagus taurus]
MILLRSLISKLIILLILTTEVVSKPLHWIDENEEIDFGKKITKPYRGSLLKNGLGLKSVFYNDGQDDEEWDYDKRIGNYYRKSPFSDKINGLFKVFENDKDWDNGRDWEFKKKFNEKYGKYFPRMK